MVVVLILSGAVTILFSLYIGNDLRTDGQDILDDVEMTRTLLGTTSPEIDEKEDEGKDKIETGNNTILYGFIISLILIASGFLAQSSVSKVKDECTKLLIELSDSETLNEKEAEEESCVIIEGED